MVKTLKGLKREKRRGSAALQNLAAVGLCLFVLGCTVAPRVVTNSRASFDGNEQTSGLLWIDAEGNRIVTAHLVERYNALMAQYGKRFVPPVAPGEGVSKCQEVMLGDKVVRSATAVGTNVFKIDAQHWFYFLTANRWRHAEGHDATLSGLKVSTDGEPRVAPASARKLRRGERASQPWAGMTEPLRGSEQGGMRYETGMPALPWDRVSAAERVPGVGEFPPARQGRITLAWENAASPLAAVWETGLEGSTDLASWTEVACLPYATRCQVTLTNRPGAEFYRAFNREVKSLNR